MEDAENERRWERLIGALESQANAINRLVQTLDHKQQKRAAAASTRMRRAVVDKPIVLTPLAEAAVKRALARVTR